MSADTTDENTTDEVDEAPAWTPPEGHTTLLPKAIRDAGASAIVYDASLPADGIVEHGSPGEFVNSMVIEGEGDPQAQDPGAVVEAGAHETPQPPAGAVPPRPPAKKAAARKAPAKKAAAKKAAASK